ncbi:MAG TPA: YdeI/OmpD-associated family protein [Candidatus Nitrosotenuis sp.]|nr:YdeI/OmpD-associated family protein [Candidatus Nitrosotenuis sp.]
MRKQQIPSGVVHKMPADLQAAFDDNVTALAAWNDITPLARNEWMCWAESAKLIETRKRRVERTATELAEGKRRPCCWPGCMHRQKDGK